MLASFEAALRALTGEGRERRLASLSVAILRANRAGGILHG